MSDVAASPVTVEITDHVAVVTMDDPRRRNALGKAMLSGLTTVFEQGVDAGIRAFILRSRPGASVWCAGFDIDDLTVGEDPLAQSGPLQSLFRAIQLNPAPVIALLTGTAWGGGADLALRCDIAVATPACTLAFTPARLGLPYDPDGLLNVLQRGGLNLAMEMFATGAPVPADRALASGLLNHVVPHAEIDAFVRTMAERIATNAPLSVASAKAQLRALNAALPLSAAAMQALLETRRRALDSEDFTEGLAAFRGKRQPRFHGR